MSVNEKMTAIADAIRGKTGKTEKLSLDEMATEINEISTGERDINPEWTDWRYFCYGRPDLAQKIKYSDTSNGTNFSYMFFRTTLEETPLFDTSKGTDLSYFVNNSKSIKRIPAYDTSNCENFSYMFYQSVIETIPPLNTSKGTKFSGMFDGCTYLVAIPQIDVSNATSLIYFLGSNYALETINLIGSIRVNGLSAQYSNKLTHDSLMSIINALEDKTSDTSGTTWKVTLGSTNLAKLTTEEIAIAEGKGWTLA